MTISDRPSIRHPEAKFELFFNASKEIVVAGYAICVEVGPSGDGVRVVKPAANNLSLLAGIVHEDAAPNTDFLVQVRGWREAGALVLPDTIQLINGGDILVPVVGQWYLQRSGSGDGKSGLVEIVEAVGTSLEPLVAVLRKVFVRAM